jgi:hypothetical protein
MIKDLVAVTEQVFTPLFKNERSRLEFLFKLWVDENVEFEDG